MPLTVSNQTSELNSLISQRQSQLHPQFPRLNRTIRWKTPASMNNSTDKTNQSSAQRRISVEEEEEEEESVFGSFHKTVSMRNKNSNQLSDLQQARKRLSDSILTQSYLQQQQQIQNNPDLQGNQSIGTLNQRRSFYLPKLPRIFQTIRQSFTHLDQSEQPQKLFVIRHGERVDSTFGANWLDQVFDRTTGVYRRINLNLPKKMVKRKDLNDFLFDPPLTELGLHQCQIVGEELAAQGIQIDHVYSSPTLRCIQTADKILQGLDMREKLPIRIEPCLFEFLKWYPVIPVKWPFLDYDELKENGYNIDRSYQPFCSIERLRKDENELMFYTRSHLITTSILKNHQNNRGNVLIVGHASTIEVCTRQLTGGQPRINDLKFLALRVPFLSMHCLEKQIDGIWKAIKPPISPNKHTAVEPFDWRFFR